MTKEGEIYSPPPNELGVVTSDYCTVCHIPDSCLVFLAKMTHRVQPDRACKKKQDPPQIPQMMVSKVTNTTGTHRTQVVSPDMPENIIDENTGAKCGMGELDSKPLEIVRNVKKNPKFEECWILFTNGTHMISDSAMLQTGKNVTLVEKSCTLDSLIRQFSFIIRFIQDWVALVSQPC